MPDPVPSVSPSSRVPPSSRSLAPATAAGLVLGALAGVGTVLAAGRLAIETIQGDPAAAWLIGRASGLTSYLLLLALVSLGLLLSHPWARRFRRPTLGARIRTHAALATFTLVFTALHVIVVATEPSAQLGWRDLLLPFASAHRPVPRTLGVLAVWSGLLTGVTARLAGRFTTRIWWPVHKLAIGAFLLTWAHSVIAGSDTPSLRGFYLASGIAVLALAITRYGARTSADRVTELTRSIEELATEPELLTTQRGAR